MPTKQNNEVKIGIVQSKQKNGDIYVLERKTVYDSDKKYTKVLSTKLLHKIPKDTTTPVSTRPKRSSFDKTSESSDKIVASRKRIGMMDILAHIGTASGVDEGIYDNTDIGTAQKIISIARYLLATNGQSLPGIVPWQLNHPIPYEDGLSENIYHDLFVQIGRDETFQQNFFVSRCAALTEKVVLAYDSTHIQTYSENQIEARYGYDRTGEGLKTIKQLTFYSIETRQPIVFTKQPGNIPDVIAIENGLKQLSVIGLRGAEIVTDNGFYSEDNIALLFLASFDFITLVKTSTKWVKSELCNRADAFGNMSTVCPFDTETHGITITLMRNFEKVRKYADKRKGLKKGDKETFRRRVYLHLYFNPKRQVEATSCFTKELMELKNSIEEGVAVDSMPEATQKKVSKYFIIKRKNGKAVVQFNEVACGEARKYHGYFALVSNSEKDTFDCLRKYRQREMIESFFEALKYRADSARIRVWDADTLRGRMFTQFITLCYYEYISNEIREMKKVLGSKNGDHNHDLAANIKLEKKLKSWLEHEPIYVVLQWFDAIEGVKISSKLHSKRWATEITLRDKMFLEKLGVVRSY
jgi:transposase